MIDPAFMPVWSAFCCWVSWINDAGPDVPASAATFVDNQFADEPVWRRRVIVRLFLELAQRMRTAQQQQKDLEDAANAKKQPGANGDA